MAEKCDKCGKEFKSEHGLLTHVGIAHRGAPKEVPRKSPGEMEPLEKERLRTCYLKLKRMMDTKVFNLAEMDYILRELKRASEAT
jgi:hypothetical protein